jgi:hypothetical protein
VEIDYGVASYSFFAFDELVRRGEIAILPPEQESAKRVELTDGMRLRQKDGTVITVEPHVVAGRVMLCGNGYTREHVLEMIELGTLSVVGPGTATDLETDPRILELEAACVERDQRIAELERKLARAAAAERIYENTLTTIGNAIAGRPVGKPLVADVDALRAADWDLSYAACFLERTVHDICTLHTRASAAESKLADAMAHGLDALLAMYPDLAEMSVVRDSSEALVVRCNNGTWTTGRTHGSLRFALHNAVLAVGGKLPTE